MGGRQPNAAPQGSGQSWEDLPAWGGKASVPPTPGPPPATGQEALQGTQGCGCCSRAVTLLWGHRDRLGHCRQLDATLGMKSRPTDCSGHSRESWLVTESPSNAAQEPSLAERRLPTPPQGGCGTTRASFPGTATEGASSSPPSPRETQPAPARAPLKRSRRCPGWCPWAGAEHSPGQTFLHHGAGGTRNLLSATRQASGQTSAFSRTSETVPTAEVMDL